MKNKENIFNVGDEGGAFEDAGELASFREDKEQIILEFTPKEFLKILSADNFSDALIAASEKTQQLGRETSFILKVLADKTVYISDVRLGENASMANSEIIKEIDGDIETNEGNPEKLFGVLLDFHFHPDVGGAIIPSPSDLITFEPKDIKPLFIGVGQVSESGNIAEILLIKPKEKAVITKETISQYTDDLKEIPLDIGKSGQLDIEKILSENGFETFLVSFVKRKNKYALPDYSKETILEDIKNIKVSLL